MYRTRVLPEIDMNPPGLVIEDFNMTFEVYQKRLGKVGFTLRRRRRDPGPGQLPRLRAADQAVGGRAVADGPAAPAPGRTCSRAMLALLLLELVTSSVLFVLLPLVLLVLAVPELAGGAASWPWFADVYAAVSAHVRLTTVLFGVVLPDYLLTCRWR